MVSEEATANSTQLHLLVAVVAVHGPLITVVIVVVVVQVAEAVQTAAHGQVVLVQQDKVLMEDSQMLLLANRTLVLVAVELEVLENKTTLTELLDQLVVVDMEYVQTSQVLQQFVELVAEVELTGQVDKKSQLELIHVKIVVVETAVDLSKATAQLRLQEETDRRILVAAAVVRVNMNVQAELAAQEWSLLDIQSDT
jgi:hypothetical protein